MFIIKKQECCIHIWNKPSSVRYCSRWMSDRQNGLYDMLAFYSTLVLVQSDLRTQVCRLCKSRRQDNEDLILSWHRDRIKFVLFSSTDKRIRFDKPMFNPESIYSLLVLAQRNSWIESTLLKLASRMSLKINLMFRFNTLRTYETKLSLQLWSAQLVKRCKS